MRSVHTSCKLKLRVSFQPRIANANSNCNSVGNGFVPFGLPVSKIGDLRHSGEDWEFFQLATTEQIDRFHSYSVEGQYELPYHRE